MMRTVFCLLKPALFFIIFSSLAFSCSTESGPDIESVPHPQNPRSGLSGSPLIPDTLMAVSFPETQDLILAAYWDPASSDRVISFFEDLTGSREIAALVLHNAVVFNIPPALAFSLCWEESRYNPQALNVNRNETIDRGLFQLNSASFPLLSEEDFFNLEINIRNGLSHLRWCLDLAGTEVAGLAMYNAGSNRVSSDGTPKKTLDYISRILKREREIETLFLESASPEPEIIEIAGKAKPFIFRLNLLAPLGWR